MLPVKTSSLRNLVSSGAKVLLNKTSLRTHFKPPFFYGPHYMGGFDYHNRERYPRKPSRTKEEDLLDEVHEIRRMKIDNPSPFHVVRRVKTMSKLPWTQKVTLRRLNLHSSFNGECVVIPNTPQFNALIAKVKHLLTVKPAILPDGRIPNEDDIGALKVCPYTGVISIDEKMRLQEKRLCAEKPELFRGNFLRYQINQKHGINSNNPSFFQLPRYSN